MSMANLTSPKTSKLGSLLCQLFGHRYIVSKKITKHVNEYQCTQCNKQVTTDAFGRLTVLNAKRKEINTALAAMYSKRKRHKKSTEKIKRVA